MVAWFGCCPPTYRSISPGSTSHCVVQSCISLAVTVNISWWEKWRCASMHACVSAYILCIIITYNACEILISECLSVKANNSVSDLADDLYVSCLRMQLYAQMYACVTLRNALLGSLLHIQATVYEVLQLGSRSKPTLVHAL